MTNKNGHRDHDFFLARHALLQDGAVGEVNSKTLKPTCHDPTSKAEHSFDAFVQFAAAT